MGIIKIGEFSKMLGISHQTLRNYEKRGILVPYHLPSGHRYYTEKHIKEAMSYGMVVKDIKNE